ncbi:LTA synthase family protein [Thermoflavifilum thermophilum]|uniref:Phosphoglycerol transferase MdoB n=1 Tax=Thermoflavifilum thermophilum TaxID=1393122 RepID=A0A1I7NHH6_9BACT|nr:alkaline phosphatase family protein [Thermoflavifilum thermophilum]SFV34102.1 Phosphoglycerol transferase MdoB [Thermoflavifilum thermophilum]
MGQIIRWLVKLFLFWLLVFACNRMLFFVVNHVQVANFSFRELLLSFRYALPLDISTACYSMVIPFLLMLGGYMTGKHVLKQISLFVVLFFLFIHGSIAYGEAAVYTEWQSKLNYEALAHFRHPSEVFHTASWQLTFLFFGCTILLDAVYAWIYIRYVHIRTLHISNSIAHRVGIGLLSLVSIGFLLFTGIRGGWKRFPISESISYFSTHSMLNDAAVNPTWNLVRNLLSHYSHERYNPYHYFSDAEAHQIVDSLYAVPKDTIPTILTTSRPNIILIILESFTADGVNPVITPTLDSLIQQGIYFDSLYASGHVSDQGIPAILSAFPATSGVSVCDDPQMTVHLPGINEDLQRVGYHTGFLYGGQLDFGNLRAYAFNKHFDWVRDGHDLPASLPRGALGIPDGIIWKILLQQLQQTDTPFFYCWYTLSSHIPYDIPAPDTLQVSPYQIPFINSMHYTDAALGALLHATQHETWFKNTLWVLVADHSHESQFPRALEEKLRHRIPLIFAGEVISPQWRGIVMHRISSQLDIAATLLNQLHIPAHKRYPWSRNLFNPYTPEFADYNFFTGTGFVTPQGYVALLNNNPRYVMAEISDSSLIPAYIRLAHAIQQVAYDDFLKLKP